MFDLIEKQPSGHVCQTSFHRFFVEVFLFEYLGKVQNLKAKINCLAKEKLFTTIFSKLIAHRLIKAVKFFQGFQEFFIQMIHQRSDFNKLIISLYVDNVKKW